MENIAITTKRIVAAYTQPERLHAVCIYGGLYIPTSELEGLPTQDAHIKVARLLCAKIQGRAYWQSVSNEHIWDSPMITAPMNSKRNTSFVHILIPGDA